MYQLRDCARRLTERPTHGFETHRWVGVGEPAGRFISIFDGHGQVLVLLKLAGKSPQGTQYPVLVNNLDLFAHRNSSSADGNRDTRICRAVTSPTAPN